MTNDTKDMPRGSKADRSIVANGGVLRHGRMTRRGAERASAFFKSLAASKIQHAWRKTVRYNVYITLRIINYNHRHPIPIYKEYGPYGPFEDLPADICARVGGIFADKREQGSDSGAWGKDTDVQLASRRIVRLNQLSILRKALPLHLIPLRLSVTNLGSFVCDIMASAYPSKSCSSSTTWKPACMAVPSAPSKM